MDPSIAAVIITGTVVGVSSWWGNRHSRVSAVEQRVDLLEMRLGKVVAYAQVLRDHIYRGDPPPPPAWPDLD